MDSLASTAIYLASLTTAQAPSTIPSVPTVSVTFAAPATRQAVELRLADTVVVANPFTAARSRGGKSLSEAIAAEVKRDAVERSAFDGDTASFDPERDLRDDSLSEDVTAAHDARIDFIRRRMDELRLEDATSAPMLRKLSTKLAFAMAAHRLAVARNAIGYLPANCDPGSDGCRTAPIAIATNAFTDHQGSGHARAHRSAVSRHKATTAVVVATARPLPMGAAFDTGRRSLSPGVRRVADIHRERSYRVPGPTHREVASGGPAHHRGVDRLTAQEATRRGVADAAHADASDHARRLLATARRLLESGHPHPDTKMAETGRAGVKLAGLLNWDGSETWSLANYPRHAA